MCIRDRVSTQSTGRPFVCVAMNNQAALMSLELTRAAQLRDHVAGTGSLEVFPSTDLQTIGLGTRGWLQTRAEDREVPQEMEGELLEMLRDLGLAELEATFMRARVWNPGQKRMTPIYSLAQLCDLYLAIGPMLFEQLLSDIQIEHLYQRQQLLLAVQTFKASGRPNILGRASNHYLPGPSPHLSLIHISEPTRLLSISYAVFCLKKKKKNTHKTTKDYITNIDKII
eukprot:TRINITY_DN14813_c0_g1_i1.p1 TRINITY_DN14813_c0_g1~~TRINITY_DN14813_c0_g1_i1.p1  ORF type:complete len:227 (-),score=61.47 TRINITY_DN14813_c0_g1_i1:3-683(-)